MKKDKLWTPEEDEKLKKYLALEQSRTVIGQKLGRSKNSVIGRVRRLGIKPNENRPFEKDRYLTSNLERRSPKKIVKSTGVKEYHYSGDIPLLDIREGQCRYSQDVGALMKCCGKPTHAKGYCKQHIGVMYK